MFLYARRDSSHPLFTDTNFYSPERNYKYYPVFLVLKYNIYPFFLVLNYKNYLFLPERNLSRLGSAPTFSVGAFRYASTTLRLLNDRSALEPAFFTPTF
jgi:hypothetical protein